MQPHLNSDTVNYIKENAQTIFFILFSINVSFLSGFFVMSPISFLHLVDGYFILSATSQLNIFCTFALFLWVLNLKLYSIEPKTSNIEVIQIIISEREIFAFMFLFILFFYFLGFKLFPYLFSYLFIVALYYLRYKSNYSKSYNIRIFNIYKKYTLKSWKRLGLPYTKAFIKDAAPVLLSVSFIFLGAQRFYYLKEERVFEYKLLNGKYGVASLIGENNNGLVFYSNENKFIIIPKSSLQTLTPIIDKKSKNMPIENQNFDLEKKNSHIDFHP